jgi:hypothetical protein
MGNIGAAPRSTGAVASSARSHAFAAELTAPSYLQSPRRPRRESARNYSLTHA